MTLKVSRRRSATLRPIPVCVCMREGDREGESESESDREEDRERNACTKIERDKDKVIKIES